MKRTTVAVHEDTQNEAYELFFAGLGNVATVCLCRETVCETKINEPSNFVGDIVSGK